MMDRRAFIVGGAATLVAPLALKAQQAGKEAKVGYLGTSPPSHSSGARRLWNHFLEGLREHGWVEGQNLLIESRFSEGRSDRFPDLAAQLVRLKVELIVAASPPAIRAAMDATATIPIVLIGTGYPVTLGFVASLARPGGNVTGVAYFPGGEGSPGKRLQLLKEAVPTLSRVALLTNPENAGHRPGLAELQVGAEALKLTLQSLEVRTSEELANAFAVAVRQRADGLIQIPDPMFFRQRTRIVQLAAESRLPALYSSREWVEAGGLMSWGVDFADQYRALGRYIDRILKGVKPADLPVEQASKWELLISLKIARSLGLTIPPSLLLRADQVIE
jgi:putative ABC transport system substrate-binding protein